MRDRSAKLSNMKIFVSWSGPQSLLVAESLKTWLPSILMNKVELFVSSQDIAKGDRGLSVIADELEGHNFGLVVLNRANLNSPWVNFETGALTKSLGKSYVSPLLLDITDADLVGPLAQFQATALTDWEDVWKLVKSINSVLDQGLPDESVRVLFEARWSQFELVVEAALAGTVPETTRSDKELLEEVLETVRGIARNQSVDRHVPAVGLPGSKAARAFSDVPRRYAPESAEIDALVSRLYSAIPNINSIGIEDPGTSGRRVINLSFDDDVRSVKQIMTEAQDIAFVENVILRLSVNGNSYTVEP